MDKLEQFYAAIKSEMAVPLATAAAGRVSMRLVSPVYYEGGVLLFTARDSLKFTQLTAEPSACILAGGYFAECRASFLGPTMLESNKALREAYAAKFSDAFDEGVELGGRDKEFILLKLTRLSGWAFENDVPNAEGVPTLPVDISLS